MDKKLKAKWVKALRSGRYKQGGGMLFNEGGRYCCLGALARIQGCNLKAILAANSDALITQDLPTGYGAGVRPPQRKRLANMNDGVGGEPKSNFKEIAEYIERHL